MFKYLILTLLVCLVGHECRNVADSKNESKLNQEWGFYTDSLVNVKIYCFCCGYSTYEQPNDSSIVEHCTTAFPVQASSITKLEYLKSEYSDSSLNEAFQNCLGKNNVVKVDTLDNVLIDARMVLLLSYDKSRMDTMVVNGSGRVILNRVQILRYNNFVACMRKFIQSMKS